jgi:lysophospholipase L1-like esterase
MGTMILGTLSIGSVLSGCSGSIIPQALTSYEVQTADLQDNGYPNSGAPRQSTFASFTFQTDADSITVTGTTTLYNLSPNYAQIGLRVDGVDKKPLAFTANNQQTFEVHLGTAGTLRTIVLRSGVQSNPSGVTLGSFIDAVAYPIASHFVIVVPTVGIRNLLYGDSITEGDNAQYPTNEAYAVLLRDVYGLRVMVEGWGYRSLYYDAATIATQDNLTTRFASYSPASILILIGTNDYGLDLWDAKDFGNAYASMLDKLHAALPETKVVCVTPIPRASEVANIFGDTLSDYRSQIGSAAASRLWVTLVDGTTILSIADLSADGIHPTTAGQAKLAATLAPYLLPTIAK